MKKKKLNIKLHLNKESIANLNDVKGGGNLSAARTECICAETMQINCNETKEFKTCGETDNRTCYTQGDECCTAGTSAIICC